MKKIVLFIIFTMILAGAMFVWSRYIFQDNEAKADIFDQIIEERKKEGKSAVEKYPQGNRFVLENEKDKAIADSAPVTELPTIDWVALSVFLGAIVITGIVVYFLYKKGLLGSIIKAIDIKLFIFLYVMTAPFSYLVYNSRRNR